MAFDMYSENILDHYKYPDHKEELKDANAKASDVNTSCGDKLTFQFKIKQPETQNKQGKAQTVGSQKNELTLEQKQAGLIENAGFTGVGCAISQSSADILAEMTLGKTVKQVLAFDRKTILDALGTPISATRVKCAMLGLKVAKMALYDYLGQKGDFEEFKDVNG